MPLTGALALIGAPVDTLVTLGAWLSGHPGDVVHDSIPEGADSKHVCRVASAHLEIGGRHFVRQAMFNLPNPPEGEQLPDTTRLAEQECHLRGIWLVAADPDSARVYAFADSITRVLDASFGKSMHGIRIFGSGMGSWAHSHTWAVPGSSANVVLGVNPAEPVLSQDEDGNTVAGKASAPGRSPELIIASVTPHSGFDHDDYVAPLGADNEEEGERDLDLARADSLLALAALPELTAALRPALAQFAHRDTSGNFRTPAFDSAMLRSTVVVHDAMAALEPARRAAAMLAVDLTLHHTLNRLGVDSGDASSALRDALAASGAVYQCEHIADGCYYRRDWLWGAYHQDSTGRAGHMAFVSLLGSGWGIEAGCGRSPLEKGDVTEHAELALKHGDNDPEIHYYAGLADQDIVALASVGPGDDYIDPKQYIPRAPAARVRAIAHFRAALMGLRDRRMRRHAWRMATALMLGHSLETRFVCIND